MIKALMWVAAVLAGLALIVGMLAHWQMLGVLNLADRLWPGASGERVAEAVPYGDDAAQRVDVYAPAGHRLSDRKPVIIWIHGGGWVAGSRPLYGFAGRAYSAEGFVTVVAGYRLAPQNPYPAFMEDAASAIRWTRANIARYGGDPDRIVIAGQSAGAHMGVLAVLDPRWLGELGNAGGPIKGVIGLSGPYDFLPFEPGGYADRAMGRVRPLEQTQPIQFARANVPPMLLVTGDADTTVRPRNSRRLAAALEAQGNVVELRVYPGVDHVTTATALSLVHRDRAPVLADSVAFARRVTAPGGGADSPQATE